MAKLTFLLGGAGLAALLVLSGCGDDGASPFDQGLGNPSSDIDPGGGDADGDFDGFGVSIDGTFDVSSAPAGFPSELIPESFQDGTSLNLPGQYTASFTSSTAAADSIAYYTERLGEPGIAVEGDPGEFNATWELESGWIVSVLGGPTESFIGISIFDESLTG